MRCGQPAANDLCIQCESVWAIDPTLDALADVSLTSVHRTRRTSWTAADLLRVDLPEPRWAVDPLFPEGLAFMAGAPKLGKSWFALGVGIAVASGGCALGTIQVDRGEVLYLALEDNARRLQERLRMLLRGDAAPQGLYLETQWPRLGVGGDDQLVAWVTEHPAARLVIVDVYPRVRPLTHGRISFETDYEAASLLQAIAVEFGVAIVALYHTRKAESSDFVEMVQGTFGTAAAADTIVVVKRARGEADATLHVTGRDVLEQELALRFAADVGTWELLGDAAEYAVGETRRLILEAVRDHGTLSPKDASDITGVTHEAAKKAMQRMFKDGQLAASDGRYTAVPAVPESPDEHYTGTGGQEGHLSSEGGSHPPEPPVTEAEIRRVLTDLPEWREAPPKLLVRYVQELRRRGYFEAPA